MSTSSAPVEPGWHLPDSRQPTSMSVTPATNIVAQYGDHTYQMNPFSRVPMTSPFLVQHLEQNSFEPKVRLMYNMIEKTTGWHLRVAPPKRGEYNQDVEIEVYPRRALPAVPEDVPPPVWTSYSDSRRTTMDRYSAQFEIEGDFLASGVLAAQEKYDNYVASLTSGALISLKMKITASFMQAKQNTWARAQRPRDPTANKNMLEITERERGGYVSLSRKQKGYYLLVNNVKELAKQADFEFNIMVVPNGTLNMVALNNFHTENFRVGSSAIENLVMGGKKLASMIDGLEVYEDSKWSINGMNNQEEEAFLHYSMHGGWSYNRGNVECDDDDDPDCKYGIAYISRGEKNWMVKSLTQLLRESGRFDQSGEQDGHVFDVAEHWEAYCRACKLQVHEGRLDPMIYRLDSNVINSGSTSQYVVARRFGEVDIRYSTLDHVKRCVRRVQHLLKERLGTHELAAFNKLTSIKNTLMDVTNPSEAQEALAAALSIANSPDEMEYDDTLFGFTIPNDLAIFLQSDTFNKAPKNIPSLVPLDRIPLGTARASNLPEVVKAGASKALVVRMDNVDCIIMAVKLDKQAKDNGSKGYNRGPQNTVYEYVAVPLDSPLLAAALADPDVNDPLRIESIYKTGANAAAVGLEDADPSKSSFVSPEVYNQRNVRYTQADLRWVFRTTDAVQKGADNAKGKPTLQGEHYKVLAKAPGQGFLFPTIARAPELPYYYGGINGLRYLAELHKNSDDHGWDRDMLRDCYEGVAAFDKIMHIFMSVFTTRNMYFDPKMVPLHLKSDDEEINRLNTAINALWGSNQKPFLVRRSHRMKAAAGHWVFPRTFPAWKDAATSSTVWIETVANIMNNHLGLGVDTNKAMAAADDWATNGGNAGVLSAFATVASVAILLDSGVLNGNVKNVINNQTQWNAFKNDYQQSTASLTYAETLKRRSPTVHNAALSTYRDISTFINQEVKPFFELARAALGKVLFEQANGRPIPQSELSTYCKNIYAFGLLLSGVITIWLDSHDMPANITEKFLRSKRLAALESGSLGVATSKGEDDLKMLQSAAKSVMDNVRSAGVASDIGQSASKNTSQYWVNTGLVVSPSLWKRWQSDMKSATTALSSGVTAAKILKLSHIYNMPFRPMMGADHGKPIAGEPITEAEFAAMVTGGGNVAQLFNARAEHMSQAMTRASNMERSNAGEPSVTVTGKYKTHIRDAEQIARQVSNSVFESVSSRHVPIEFMGRDPSAGSDYNSSYLVNVETENRGAGGPVDRQVEPHWLNYRLSKIDEFYRDDVLGKMIAHLWCFSPIHLGVIENMISHKVTPYGVGFVMLRPFIRDRTGAVLFTISGGVVAESRVTATFANRGFNQQNNKYNIKFSAMLGCGIYQEDKILWERSQTMHGNESGLTGEMYTDKNTFIPTQPTRGGKDGFLVYTGDNLKLEEIPACVSITSQYNVDRYGNMVNNRAVLSTVEQHIPGLIYTITKHRLNEINLGHWNHRSSFWEEKFGTFTNSDCYSEDYCTWNSATKSYSTLHRGQWHFSGLTPVDSDFLAGKGLMSVVEKPLLSYTG